MQAWDYLAVGPGFGGSVSALRLVDRPGFGERGLLMPRMYSRIMARPRPRAHGGNPPRPRSWPGASPGRSTEHRQPGHRNPGGCVMGDSPAAGVISPDHPVWGYAGLYVVDGSAVSANPGVNPSLTTCARAERAMERIPAKEVVRDESFAAAA